MTGELGADMQFPNPVERHDLPVERKRWPKVLGALCVLGVLFVIFLPQFLHTRIGLKLIKLYVSSKVPGSEVQLYDFHTSWFGGTTATHFVIQQSDGRNVSFDSLKSDISLGRLLRGSFKLGNARVDGLYIDYVLDYGDGTDWLTHVFPGLAPDAKGGAFVSIPEPKLAADSLEISNGTINFIRGHVDPDTLVMKYESFRVADIHGTVKAASLHTPCSGDLTGTIGTEEKQTGDVHAFGTFAFGENGVITPKTILMDLSIEGRNWPTAAVAPVLVSRWPTKDYLQAVGETVETVAIPIKAADGEIGIAPLSLHSSLSDMQVPLVYDMNSVPRRWKLGDGPNNLAMGLAKGFARSALSHVVPMLGESAGDGKMLFHFDALSLPLGKAFNGQTDVRGEIQIKDAPIEPSHQILNETGPRSLTRQIFTMAGVSADASAKPKLNVPPLKFDLHDGQVKVEATTAPITLGAARLHLTGTSIIDGPMRMVITFVDLPRLHAAVPQLAIGPMAALAIPVIGTVQEPRLDLDAVKNALPPPVARLLGDFMDAQIAVLRAKDAEGASRAGDAQVNQILSPFQGTTPTTRP